MTSTRLAHDVHSSLRVDADLLEFSETSDLERGCNVVVTGFLIWIVPAGIDSKVYATLYVGGQAVSDDKDLGTRWRPHAKKGDLEDFRVGFGCADFFGDQDLAKVRSDRGAIQSRALHVQQTVGDQGHLDVWPQGFEDFLGALKQMAIAREVPLVVFGELTWVGALHPEFFQEILEATDAQPGLIDFTLLEGLPVARIDLPVQLQMAGFEPATVRLDGALQRLACGAVEVEQRVVRVKEDPPVAHCFRKRRQGPEVKPGMGVSGPLAWCIQGLAS